MSPRLPRSLELPLLACSDEGVPPSDVVAPLSGEIVEVNGALSDSPETINDDPYGEGWLVKVRVSDPSEQEALLDKAARYLA